jgi:hypothetical protein
VGVHGGAVAEDVPSKVPKLSIPRIYSLCTDVTLSLLSSRVTAVHSLLKSEQVLPTGVEK